LTKQLGSQVGLHDEPLPVQLLRGIITLILQAGY
jgi:hypothetical protein